jgi:hypothetical protein
MSESTLSSTPRPRPSSVAAAAAMLTVLAALAPAWAGGPVWAPARSGLDLAAAAARSWSDDAFLVYIENDEPVDLAGACSRWGYLFYSPSLEKTRVYSVRAGKILVAENLDVKVEPPPIASGWIDSDAALAAAHEHSGQDFCKEYEGKLTTMLLMRGAFNEDDPDQTTWMLVYTSPHAPSLFVVVDAAEGKVRKTWRG